MRKTIGQMAGRVKFTENEIAMALNEEVQLMNSQVSF